MDMTYEEYIDFINHLFLEMLVDFDYQLDNTSTKDAMEIL